MAYDGILNLKKVGCKIQVYPLLPSEINEVKLWYIILLYMNPWNLKHPQEEFRVHDGQSLLSGFNNS